MLPGLKVLVKTMLAAIPQLLNVFFLLAFVLLVFGILGVQLFSGTMHGRCRVTPYPIAVPAADITFDGSGQLPPYFAAMYDVFHNPDGPSVANQSYYDTVISDRDAFPWCGMTPVSQP